MKNVVIFTGAGVSVASGLGTFRGSAKALWENFDVNAVCNLNTFHSNRKQVFEFYNMRKVQYNGVKPNAAHIAIQEVIKATGAKLFTSNVDTLHEAAGSKAIHVHGQFDEMQCLECNSRWYIGDELFAEDGICPQCASNDVKMGVILFNERAPRYTDLHAAVSNDSIKVVIGTSLNVLGPYSLGYGYKGPMILIDPEANKEDHGQYFDFILVKKAEDVSSAEILELIAKANAM